MRTSDNPRLKQALSKMGPLQSDILATYGQLTPVVYQLIALLITQKVITETDRSGTGSPPGLLGDTTHWRDLSWSGRLNLEEQRGASKRSLDKTGARLRVPGKIENLRLPPRVLGKLKEEMEFDGSAATVKELLSLTEKQVRQVVGPKELETVKRRLEAYGLKLNTPDYELTDGQKRALRREPMRALKGIKKDLSSLEGGRPELPWRNIYEQTALWHGPDGFIKAFVDILKERSGYKGRAAWEISDHSTALKRLEGRGLLRRIDGTRGKGKKRRTEKVRLTPLGVEGAVEKIIEMRVDIGALEWVGYSMQDLK